MKVIKTEDSLPEYDYFVLLWTGDRWEIGCRKWTNIDGEHYKLETQINDYSNIVAWCELPHNFKPD